MANHSIAVDLGLTEYAFCWKLQQAIHEARRRNLIPDCLILVEHPRVMTFGRRRNRGNLLVSEQALANQGIPCVDIERGGDVTYHGPGQLIAYPIFALESSGIGVLDFVERLEQIMIQMLETHGISGRRDPRNRGVWVHEKKIGFVGIAVRKGISFHGLALNVNIDLSPFQMINPCGLQNVGITSMKDLLNTAIPIEPLKKQCVLLHEKIFDCSIKKKALDDLLEILNQNDCIKDDAGENIP